MKYFIGIDLGTQSTKGMLFDPQGKLVGEHSEQYLPDFPHPNWAEIDATIWVKALKNVIAGLMAENGVAGSNIGMISIATLCGNMLPIDKAGNPLRKCILWLDRRSEPQCERLNNQITEDEACKLIGTPITASLPALKMMWLKENEPEVFDKTVMFLEPGEYLAYYMTGEIKADYSNASVSGLYDVANREWSPKMCQLAGVTIEKLPQVQASVDIVGHLKADVAEYLGLTTATQVVTGAGDQHASSIGSGLVGTGDIFNIMGTSEIIASASDHVVYDDSRILKTHLHVDPKLWQIEQGALLTGASVRWFRDNVARVSFDDMNVLAEKAPVGSKGLIFLPALSGSTSPKTNDLARGIFFGLTMSHDFESITRSVFEGCAYGFRDSIESLNTMGMGTGEIIAGGGGINSAIWMQIKADMIGKVIKILKTSDSTPLGAGMIAGVAQKNFASLEEASEQLVKYGKVYEPNPKNKARYDELYAMYRDLYDASCPVFEHYKTIK